MKKEKVKLVIPQSATEQTDWDLVNLTQYISENIEGVVNCGGGLGGEFGYGIEYENDTFMMHPFCWCLKDNCPWCSGKKPNFLYKPTKAKIWWYKWIGRGQRQTGDLPADWYEKCIESLTNQKKDEK